jgi:hypothetical protein
VVPKNLRFFRPFSVFNEAELIFFVGDGRARHVRCIAWSLSYRLTYHTSWYGLQNFLRIALTESGFWPKKTAKFWASGQSAIFFYRALYDVISKVVGLDELDIRIEKN